MFDPAELLDTCEGDRDIAVAMISVFRDEAPRLLDDLRGAVARGDVAATCQAAHALKGAVGNFGDASCFEAAFALERMGREHDMTGADAALHNLVTALAQLDAALLRFVSSSEAA